MDNKPAHANLHELTDEEFAELDFDAVRCITCTPCCMDHMHFLYKGEVLWACQTKLKKRTTRSAEQEQEQAS